MSKSITARGRFAAIFVLLLLCSACGTSQHIVRMNEGYTAPADARLAVGTVANATGFEFDVDIVEMLTSALTESLSESQLLASGAETNRIVLNARIVDYDKGDAFKRWLMPGYGSTILRVQCDLVVEGNIIGAADAKRTIDAGGAYTIGAWKTVFKTTADDLVKDVVAKLSRVE